MTDVSVESPAHPERAQASRSPWQGAADRAEREHWADVATEVAQTLARDVVQRDRENTPPHAQIDLLRDSGLTELLIPTSLGGRGGHWETAFEATRIIARVDASTAHLLGYHYLNQACIAFYGHDVERQNRWFRRSIDERLTWSDAFNPVDPDLSLEFDGTDYRLNGFKKFATGSSVTDIVITGAPASGGPYDGNLVIIGVDSRREGVHHLDDWDNIGYRTSDSGSVRFDSVRVTDADVVGVDKGDPFSTVVTPGVQLLFGNIYLGIAQGALAQGREVTLARRGTWFLSVAERYSDDPLTQRTYGDLVSHTAAVEALADSLNRRYDEVVERGDAVTAADRADLEVAIARLKVVANDVGLDVASRIYDVTGASSTRSGLGLDLHWRNIRTHSLHDPVDYKRVEVGAHYLLGTVQPISLYT